MAARHNGRVGDALKALFDCSQWYVSSMDKPIDYHRIITIEPGKRSGKPCVRGMRISVYDVLNYLAGGMTIEQVLSDFPDLTREDILACLAYAADREHRVTLVSTRVEG
jgi:uncharacterized protein (DUF433 family)